MNANVREGMTVHGKDGEKLGKVIACQPEHFIIEKGFFFPTDYLAHYDEVLEIEGDDKVILNLTADELRAAAGTTETYEGERTTAQPLHAGAREETKVPLAEEELEVEKRMREAGEVRVRKDVKTEHRQVDVPVTKEEVHVERAPASEATPADTSFQGGTVSVPIHEEEVEIRKRPAVKEEVRVSKTAKRGEMRAGADVRKETAEIEERGDVEGEGESGLPHRREPEEK